MADNQVHAVARGLGTAALTLRLGRPPVIEAELWAQMLDAELVRLPAQRPEAIVTSLGARAARAASDLKSVSNGETVVDAGQLALELSSIAAALRLLARMQEPRAA